MTKTILVWDASLSSPRPCKGPTCTAQIVWGETVKNGRKMCFDAPAVPLETKTDPQTGNVIAVMDYDTNHWASCPDAQRFR